MKNVILLLVFGFLSVAANAQNESPSPFDSTITYRVLTSDKQEFLGNILKSDERELLLRLGDGRRIIIPQFQVKKVEAVKSEEYNSVGDWVGEDKFATRYFITTNGLPMKRGEHYVQWNIFGPDFQFAVGDNFGIGLMTTWIGSPVLATAKYSFQLGEKTQFALGAVGGSGTFLAPDWGGVLPFATLSHGTRRANIALSGGYGAVWAGNNNPQGRALMSVAGMVKIAPKVSLVFDSFILLPSNETRTYTTWDYDQVTGEYTSEEVTQSYRTDLLALFVPGVRWHVDDGKAFQFGLTGVVLDDWLLPVPIPMIQWYRSF